MKNKFLLKSAVVLVVCLNISGIHAQTFEPGNGKAMIVIESKTPVIIRLDTMLLEQTKTPVSLKEGKYLIRAWAPTKELFMDTITILENRTTILTKHLKDTKEYSKYKKDLSLYKFKKTLTQFVPFPLTLGYSVFILTLYNNNKKIMNEHLANAKIAASNYENSISADDINNSKQVYDDERSSYEKYRTKNNQLVKTASIAISGGLLVSTGLFYLSKKIIRPAYKETPLLSFKNVNIMSDYSSSCLVGVVLNINR